jgi:Protein of unknwon function (DUF3310)
MNDNVNHPEHYCSHPSKIECIEITQHMNFCLGNAVKYIWRADEKGKDIEDLQKAIWYIQREIELRRKTNVAAYVEKLKTADGRVMIKPGAPMVGATLCKGDAD